MNPGARIIVTASVGSGKTEFFGHRAPTWFMGMYPKESALYITHKDSYAKRFGGMVGRTLKTYAPLFDWQFGNNTKLAAEHFTTPRGGEYFSQGITAGISGIHVRLITLDDFHGSAEAANSPTKREAVYEFYQGDLQQRLKEGASLIITSARWHHDDLIGRILSEPDHGFKQFHFPAICTDPANDILRRKEGEPLVPEIMSLAEIKRRRKSVSPYYFEALYLQRPQLRGGGLIKEGWFKHYIRRDDTLYGDNNRVCELDAAFWMITVDTAMSIKDTADYTVAQVWCVSGDDPLDRVAWLIDEWRGQQEAPNIPPLIKLLVQRYPRVTRVGIEGLQVAQYARKAKIPGVTVLPTISDKWLRAQPLANWAEDGRVMIPRIKDKPWVEEYLAELMAFPIGRYKDRLDASAHAIKYFSNMGRVGFL